MLQLKTRRKGLASYFNFMIPALGHLPFLDSLDFLEFIRHSVDFSSISFIWNDTKVCSQEFAFHDKGNMLKKSKDDLKT